MEEIILYNNKAPVNQTLKIQKKESPNDSNK